MAELIDLKPKDRCPKCGEGYFDHPRYENEWNDFSFREWLEWSCDYCGYIIKTKTVDAE